MQRKTVVTFDLNRHSGDDRSHEPCLNVVENIDLKLYIRTMDRWRIYSSALINESGHFIFYNKLAKEHFEGSLNNLKSKSIFDLMIEESRKKVMTMLQHMSCGWKFRCIIYSKNTKRKYLKLKTGKTYSKEDIYYRYLKGLSCRIRPMLIHLNP